MCTFILRAYLSLYMRLEQGSQTRISLARMWLANINYAASATATAIVQTSNYENGKTIVSHRQQNVLLSHFNRELLLEGNSDCLI